MGRYAWNCDGVVASKNSGIFSSPLVVTTLRISRLATDAGITGIPGGWKGVSHQIHYVNY